jgi:hypothetical protein
LWCATFCDDIQIEHKIGIQSYYTKYKLDISKVKEITKLGCDDLIYHETAQEQRSMVMSHGAPIDSQYLDIPDCYEDIVGGATVGLLCGTSFYLFDIHTWKQIGSIELTGQHKGNFVSSAQNGYTTILISQSEDKKVWWLSFVNSFDSLFSKTSIGEDIQNTEAVVTVKYVTMDKEDSPGQSQLVIYIYETPEVTAFSHTAVLGSDQVFAIEADPTGLPIPNSISRFSIIDANRSRSQQLVTIFEIFIWNQTRFAFHRYSSKSSSSPTELMVQVCPLSMESCRYGTPSRRLKLDFKLDTDFYNIDLSSVRVYHIMDNWILFIGSRPDYTLPAVFMCSIHPENILNESTDPLHLNCSGICEVRPPFGMTDYVVERPSFTDKSGNQIRMFLEAKNNTGNRKETVISALFVFDIEANVLLPSKEWMIESFVQWPYYDDGDWFLTTIRQRSVETFSSDINFIEIDFSRYFAEVPSSLYS